jgi:hypothetical protein
MKHLWRALCLLLIPLVVSAGLITQRPALFVAAESGGGGGGDFVTSSIPLQIIYPMEQGTAGSGLAANNRAFKQYPGLEYRIRAGVIGGTPPYDISVTGIEGMTTEAVNLPNGNTATDIVWSNPTTGSHEYTVSVTDSAAETDSQTIALTVGTSGHLFVDSSAVSSGTGTAASPYQQMDDLYANTDAENAVCWFRGGGPSYVLDNIEIGGTGEAEGEERVEFSDHPGDGRCVIWIAYPGDERPVIDYGYTGNSDGLRIRLKGEKVFVDGFHFTNGYVMGLQIDQRNQYGAYFANNVFDSLNFRVNQSNQAHIMFQGNEGPDEYGTLIVSNDFSLPETAQDVANAIKIYWQENLLIEGNDFHDMEVAVELKDTASYFTVRNNLFQPTVKLAIAGDMGSNGGSGNPNSVHGDICYNQFAQESVSGPSYYGAMKLSTTRTGDDAVGPIHVYRNTIIGRISVPGMVSVAGPHTIEKNVILNDEGSQTPIPYITDDGGTDTSRIIFEDDNLTGAFDDEKVNESTGELSGAWAQWNGLRGHRLQ